jgi:hypothetical protein
MEMSGPRDLPEFRLWLLKQWQPGQLFDGLDRLQYQFGLAKKVAGRMVSHVDGRAQRHALSHAALWWVAQDMVQLIDRAHRTLPETTLTHELIPDEAGLVVFASPITGTQADSAEPIETHAMSWVVGNVGDGREGIHITTYSHVRKGQRIGNTRIGYKESEFSYWNPSGTCNWILGSDTDAASFEGFNDDDVRRASMGEDRRVLAALWLLAAQPLAENTIKAATHNKAKRRRLADAGINASNDVRLVNVRRRRTEATGAQQGSGRTYSHRWKVGGDIGFWRQQACGPQWSQHKPIFIEPYEAGPKDKPLRVTEVVKVVKGDH